MCKLTHVVRSPFSLRFHKRELHFVNLSEFASAQLLVQAGAYFKLPELPLGPLALDMVI